MLRAASIGMGWWSDELADAAQGKSDGIRIVTCFTRSEEKRAAFAEKYGTAQHDSYEAVLADEAIDAVILTTPHSTHAEQVIAAAAAGKHVFCEKPFTLTRASAQAAVDACAEAGVVLAIGQNRRWHSATRELKYMVEGGDFGTILHAEANFSVPSALSYPPELWRSNRVESPAGSITGARHPHDRCPRLSAGAHRAGGGAGPSARGPGRHRRHDLGAIRGSSLAPRATWARCSPAPTPRTSTSTARRQRLRPDRQQSSSSSSRRTGSARETPIQPNDTLRLELDEFAAACAGEAQYTVTTEEAVHGIAVMEALVEAAATGQWVEVAGGGEA